MASGPIIAAAAGSGCILLLMIAFIIFRYKVKRNEASCWGFFSKQKHEFGTKNKNKIGIQRSPTPTISSTAEWSLTTGGSSNSKSALISSKLSLIQPDGASSGSGINCESPYPSQTLFPTDYQRKLSSSTGYSSYSSDTCHSADFAQTISISLHYRCYHDQGSGQFILHIIEARLSTPFPPAGEKSDALQPLAEHKKQQLPHHLTYVAFYLSTADGERRCGQTKTKRTNSTSQTANYNEFFSFPTGNDESMTEQRLHFDVLSYNNYSRPQSLGSTDVTLSADSLNNQDLWTDMTATMFSPPLREINGGVRSEILVFLSFCLPREELTVNLLKAKNMGGLFPAYIEDETDIYVKTCLIVDEIKIKRRTATQPFSHPANATVVFNQSLNYPIKYPQLERCVLLIYVVQRHKESKKEKTVGKCVIGPFGGSSSVGYLQWQQHSNAQVIRSNAIWHTVVRYCSDPKIDR